MKTSISRLGWIAAAGALGAAAGWVLPAATGSRPPAPAVPAPATTAAPAGTAGAPEAEPAPLEASLAAALLRELEPLDRGGPAAIRGAIRDEDERPWPGVPLVLVPELAAAGRSLGERVSRARELEDRTRTTTTDAEGRFAFEGLPADGSYAIRARSSRLWLDGRTYGVNPGETTDLRARRFDPIRRDVPIRVTFRGREVPRAEVQLAPAGASDLALRLGVERADDWTAGAPGVSVGGGGRVRAFLDGEFASPIVLLDGDEAGPVTLELEPCAALFGRLELPASLERPILLALPVDPEKAVEGHTLIEEGVEVPLTAGGFRLAGAPPGRYLLGIRVGDSPILRAWEVKVEDGVNEVTLALDSIPDEEVIAVTVTDPEGHGMEGIRSFHVDAEREESYFGSSVWPVAAEGSRYRVRLERPYVEALATGAKVELSVEDPRWGSHAVRLVPGVREYALAYPPQAELEVVIERLLGSGFEGTLDVHVIHESDADAWRSDLPWERRAPGPDFLGESRFRNLKPGSNVVEVWYTDCDAEPWEESGPASRHEVALAPGPNRLEIPLPRLHTVEVSLPAELATESFSFVRWTYPEVGGHEVRNVDAAGRVQRLRVPSGDYSVHAGGHEMHFRVDGDARIELRDTDPPPE